jgi:DNA polymerase V
MYAIVDCNSFYCSCERLFRPELDNKPVVVLSNNDGCIISRSDEARSLGVAMTGPYFESKPLIEKYGIATFSSNYNLYGDLSWRVMETLRMLVPPGHVEVYSVDEAFLNLSHINRDDLDSFCLHIKEVVEQWTGIKVSIGAAPTKVLSKLANRLAKKNKAATNCVMVLGTGRQIEEALKKTKVSDIWGVGYRYAEKLERYNIHTAYQLSRQPLAWAHTFLGGVTGLRLVRELKGVESIQMLDELENKKMIATTRMFGSPVNALSAIKEAVATYTSRAAEKLRRQQGAASIISVFVVPKEQSHHNDFRRGDTISHYTSLPVATSVTHELIKPALALTERLYRSNTYYKKAGVMLSGIVPDASIQGNLFAPPAQTRDRLLMTMIDNVNFAMRNDILKFASSGTSRDWKMRQELRSPRYTTRWEELYEVK